MSQFSFDTPDDLGSRNWLASLGISDISRSLRDLRELSAFASTPDDLRLLLTHLHRLLPSSPEPGMALTNLERFISGGASPELTVAELVRDFRRIEILVSIFATSQYFSGAMIRDPSLLDWLLGLAEARSRDSLVASLARRVRESGIDEARKLIRLHRHREMLRIGYDDIVRGFPLEVTVEGLSALAESCVEVAYRVARQNTSDRVGEPRNRAGEPCRFVVLALGKLGGSELNYSSDIDLIFLYEDEGYTDGERQISNAEFFSRMGGDLIRLLADHTSEGQAYRVDMRLRPEGDQGPLARSFAATVGYYETAGRTWERQALIKCRPIAGDLELGVQFLQSIDSFVHRRYLSSAEIGEIKAMKRRIESRTIAAGTDLQEVKTGRGGIRDVEFVVQFLQLLHGGSYPEVRHPNTLVGLTRLEEVGCLTLEERGIMEDALRFLRKVEHRLQTMFDLQTHRLPDDPEALRALAIRMGFHPATAWEDRTGPAERFMLAYRTKTELNRKILNHLLHDAFRDDQESEAADPVLDLVLGPKPTDEAIESSLSRYNFADRGTAYRNLMALAREDFEFLSQARCRHFLAAIAPRLLQEVSRAPDPDLALTNLEKVSASLGAKGILWELFNFNPPTLRLYVEICSSSQFLSEILINNPGMIDDLMDSLVVDRPQPGSVIRAELAELCRGAEDLAPILMSFRNKEWIRIGARDLLGREPIRDVTRELADVAEAIVSQVCKERWSSLCSRFGIPRLPGGVRARWAVIALGKLGGRELNYHSDIDLVFVHEGDGQLSGQSNSIENAEFFHELSRSVVKALSEHSERGILYSVDTRLRPHGNSGPLVVPLDAFRSYYEQEGRVWELLALTRGRVIFGVGDFGKLVADTIRDRLLAGVNGEVLAREVLSMRRRLEGSRSRSDLKRGLGGQVDIEFLVQYLQLLHAPGRPEILKTNLWEALDALRKAGILPEQAATELKAAYEFLRTVESRLRMLHNRGIGDCPEGKDDLQRLVRRLNPTATCLSESMSDFTSRLSHHMQTARSWFDRLVGAAEFQLISGPETAESRNANPQETECSATETKGRE